MTSLSMSISWISTTPATGGGGHEAGVGVGLQAHEGPGGLLRGHGGAQGSATVTSA